jgi:hypothetical protein
MPTRPSTTGAATCAEPASLTVARVGMDAETFRGHAPPRASHTQET